MFSSKLLFLSWTILPYRGANCHSEVCRSAGSILKGQFLYNRVWFHHFILSVHHHFPKIGYYFGVQIASGARDCEIKQDMFSESGFPQNKVRVSDPGAAHPRMKPDRMLKALMVVSRLCYIILQNNDLLCACCNDAITNLYIFMEWTILEF